MASKRRSTGKRLRFEVFKRDYFTCQYCGSQPPDVVLVADHITSVAEGGQTTIDNLITACEPCNQGKADKSLTAKQIRPDADLLYLETQQEIAELRRFESVKIERDELVDRALDHVIDTWSLYTNWNGMPLTMRRHIRSMLTDSDPYIVDDAVRIAALAMKDGRIAERIDSVIPYVYAVVRNMTKERSAEG